MAAAALASARAARAQLQALRPTVEQQQAEIERVQLRASECGMVEKTAGKSGVAGSLQRAWKKWITSPLGAQAAARVEAGEAPTLADMKAFQTHKYLHREMHSSVGRQGCGDSVGLLQIPYMLGKFVFPLMGYKGWTGLSLAEAKSKNQPLAAELRDHWKALKVQQPDATLEGRAQPKKKWDDLVYFIAQDICMADKLRPNRAVTRLAVLGFVRTTCCRSGSFAKDKFDLAGSAARWVGVNVMSVEDFTWGREGFHMVMPGCGVEEDGLFGDVNVNRVKQYYFENYRYAMSVTPDALEAARRASTWLAQYMWRRGLFEVQYAGMSSVERAEALAGRSAGYEGGMPPGAKLGSEAAFERWMQGERGYLPELRREPLFVRLDALGHFTTVELHTDEVGGVFAELGEEMGLEPHASGLNSGRRNGVVGTSKALDARGHSQMLAKKLMQHKAKSGISTIEVCYDDSTDTSDMGALLCGRAMMEKTALHGLLNTRCPELAKVRRFSDIAKDDSVRDRVFKQNPEWLSRRQEVAALKEVVALGELADDEAAEVKVELKEAARLLYNLKKRLQTVALGQKRQELFAEARASLANVPLATMRERRRVVSYVEMSVQDVHAKYGNAVDGTALLPLFSRKRALVTEAQAELLLDGVEWKVVKSWPEGRPVQPLVQASLRASRQGRVCLSVRPSKFVSSVSSLAQRQAARAGRLASEEEDRAAKRQCTEARRAARAGRLASEEEDRAAKRQCTEARRAAERAAAAEAKRAAAAEAKVAKAAIKVQKRAAARDAALEEKAAKVQKRAAARDAALEEKAAERQARAAKACARGRKQGRMLSSRLTVSRRGREVGRVKLALFTFSHPQFARA